MNTTTLINNLRFVSQKFLALAEKEKRKSDEAEYLHSIGHYVRSVSREGYFRERHLLVEELVEKLRNLSLETRKKDEEEMIFLGRKLMAEAYYPWIKRKVLAKPLYEEIYSDQTFEPYTKDLPYKQEELKQSGIKHLGLWDELEKELSTILGKISPFMSRGRYYPLIKDILIHKDTLQNLFTEYGQEKTDLICFRLYELGLE